MTGRKTATVAGGVETPADLSEAAASKTARRIVTIDPGDEGDLARRAGRKHLRQ